MKKKSYKPEQNQAAAVYWYSLKLIKSRIMFCKSMDGQTRKTKSFENLFYTFDSRNINKLKISTFSSDGLQRNTINITVYSVIEYGWKDLLAPILPRASHLLNKL